MEAKFPIKTVDNRVVLRVWLDVEDKIGHVSLQTRNCIGDNNSYGVCDNGVYISIYPTGRGVAFFNRKGCPFKTKTLEEDLNKYKRENKFRQEVELYCLNPKAIETAYKELVDLDFNFSMLGSAFFKDPKTHNCSGLVFSILQQSGIKKYFQLQPAHLSSALAPTTSKILQYSYYINFLFLLIAIVSKFIIPIPSLLVDYAAYLGYPAMFGLIMPRIFKYERLITKNVMNKLGNTLITPSDIFRIAEEFRKIEEHAVSCQNCATVLQEKEQCELQAQSSSDEPALRPNLSLSS